MNEPSEVKLHFLDYWRVVKLRLGLIFLVFFLVMVTAGVTIKFLPRQYLSTVKMEVKQDNTGGIDLLGNRARGAYDPQFVTTQFQILQTTEILYPVIEQLKLIDEFSPPGQKMSLDQVATKLRNSLKLTEVRNTSLIEIGVYDTDPQRAANIANTIAVVYQEERRQDLQKTMDSGLDQLQDQVEKQQKAVEKAAGESMNIRTRDGIVDPDPDKEGSSIGRTEGKLIFDTQQVNEQQLRVTELERQLQLISNLTPDNLMNILPTLNIQDNTIMQTLPRFQEALATEAWMTSSGVGENHPRMQALRAQKKIYSKTLSDELESIRKTQASRLLLEKDKLKALEARMDESRKGEIDEKTKIAEYIDAKNKYIQARRISETLESNLSTERVKRHVETEPAKIWQKAERSDIPAKPAAFFYMCFAAGGGLLAGVLLAFFIEYLDTSVKTIDDVERYLQVPVLAIIPKNVSILMNTRGDTADAEAYRILRTNIEFNKPQRDANTFTLISGGPGEGKSTTLNNLAYTCAKGGYNVLVVDADLRRATQHQLFNVDNKLGLTDYLLGRVEIDEIVKTTKIDNLSFISSGELPSDALGILNSQRMTNLIAKVKQQYDLVFFDAPPILGVSDGSVIVSEVDVTIMVVQHRRFPRSMLQRVKQSVANVGGRLIGVVLNNFDSKHDDGYAYYNNYYDYYAPREPQRIKPTPPKLPARAPRFAKIINAPRIMRLLAVACLFMLAASLRAQTVSSVRTGDVFEMQLSGMPQDMASEFHLQYPVGQDGVANIPLIGEVKVSGLTATQIEREIQAKLEAEKIFTRPTVIINVMAGSRFVSVGGGVKNPQRLQWSQDLTLQTAISDAGGLDEFGSPKGVRLIRDGKIVNSYDLRVLEKDPSQDPRLFPGDKVYVRK